MRYILLFIQVLLGKVSLELQSTVMSMNIKIAQQKGFHMISIIKFFQSKINGCLEFASLQGSYECIFLSDALAVQIYIYYIVFTVYLREMRSLVALRHSLILQSVYVFDQGL